MAEQDPKDRADNTILIDSMLARARREVSESGPEAGDAALALRAAEERAVQRGESKGGVWTSYVGDRTEASEQEPTEGLER